MSRSVIISDIMPIVERIFSKLGTDLPYGSIRDKKLIDFLDEQLSHRFRIAGQDEHCEQLEEQIKQAKQNDSKELENLINFLGSRSVKAVAVIIIGIIIIVAGKIYIEFK